MSQQQDRGERSGENLIDSILEVVDHSYMGRYQSCVLHIQTHSLMDLAPEHGQVTETAIATHAHEYVHYLHSIGTTAGQAYLLFNLLLLRNLVGGSDVHGHFLGAHVLREVNRFASKEFLQAMQDLRGHRSPELHRGGALLQRRPINWSFDGASRLTAGPMGIQRVLVGVSAEHSNGTRVHGSFDVGYSFVTEGVAYEVDREIRRKQGAPISTLDDRANYFPYLAYGDLVDQWVGRRTSARERILIGNVALGTPSVGVGMQRACKAARKGKRPAEVALKKKFDDANVLSELWTRKLRAAVPYTGPGPIVTQGLKAYVTLIDLANDCRRRLKAPELLFLEQRLDVPGFRSVLASLVDCMLIQEKPDQSVEMSWIGPNQVALDEEEASQIAAMQSAFHFNHLHHRNQGEVAATGTLTETRCPYATACEVEVPPEQKRYCSSSPWMMSLNAHSGNKVCWYSAGVKALSGHHPSEASQLAGR